MHNNALIIDVISLSLQKYPQLVNICSRLAHPEHGRNVAIC